MSTTVNLSVGSGETKNLTFNCGGTFVPDDIEFVITGSGGDTNTTLSGIAYCGTGASTTAKVATMPGFALSSGQRIILYLSTTNTKASATLNVNSTGAKPIKIGGANTTTSNFTAGYWFFYYDGSNWNAEKMDNSKMANSAGYTTNTGTVTSVGLSNATNGGLTISGSPITGSGSITIGHSNVLASAQSTQAVYPITIDKNGHITSYGSAVTIPTGSGSHSGVAYCSTAANTGAKVAELPGFSISTESPFKTHAIILYVLNSNTYSGTCTLNVNGTGAMGMRMWNGSSWSTVSGNMLKSGYYYCYYDGNSNSDWYLRPLEATSSGNLVCTNSSSGTTNTAVSSGDVYLNYVENGSVVDSIALHGMGGTTITSTVVSGYPPQIRISSTTGGSGGGAEYLNDLYDVYTTPYNGQFLQYNGSGWTGAAALTQITAGSGLNATSGNTTNDGGSITASTSSNNNPPVTSTGTIHLTRVNTGSGYNDGNNNTLTKVAAGPTSNITVSSSSNTLNVPYFKVDKFGRVTDLTNRTVTINGLGGGGGGGSTVSAVGSESQTNGYKAGSITIDGGTTYFTVSPARAVQYGGSSSGEFSFQGVVRPIAEVTMSDTQFSDIDGGISWYSDEINGICKVACAPDFYMGGVFIPITMLYHYNYTTYRWESVPYLFVPSGLAEAFTGVYKEVFDFPK